MGQLGAWIIGLRFHFLHPAWGQVAIFGSLAMLSHWLRWRRKRGGR